MFIAVLFGVVRVSRLFVLLVGLTASFGCLDFVVLFVGYLFGWLGLGVGICLFNDLFGGVCLLC